MTTDEAATTFRIDARDAFATLGRLSLGAESMDSVLDRIAHLAKATIPGTA